MQGLIYKLACHDDIIETEPPIKTTTCEVRSITKCGCVDQEKRFSSLLALRAVFKLGE